MRRFFPFAAVALLAFAAHADETMHHPLWQVDGDNATVYLLGSIHLLRPDDYPLADVIYAAYDDAESLLMELDLDDLDEIEMAKLINEMGRADTSLKQMMGDEAFELAKQKALLLGLDLNRLNEIEPWYAALTVVNLQMMRLGFDPANGVDLHFATRAAEDGKEIEGLETARFQLSIFDDLPMDQQRELLLVSLDEAVELADLVDDMVAGWKSGDSEQLETMLLESFQQFPDVYQEIIVDRNLRWTDVIEPLLDGNADVLVVVGALHLVGDDSVIAMLEDRGHTVRQH